MGIGEWIVGFAIGICVLTVLVSSVVFLHVKLNVEPTYIRAVSSHLDNAYELNSPEQMLEEVNLAQQGMVDLGLKETMYTEAFSWDQMPNKRMKFQFTYMEGLKERIQAVIDWKANTKNNSIESLGDVYEQKMMNLRKFIMEDADGHKQRSDWIAHDAWYYNMHPTLYWLGYIESTLFIITALIAVIGSASVLR